MKPGYDYKKFDTQAEAEAFIYGVEYVNDSAITVRLVGERYGGFLVEIYDEDKAEEL